MNELLELIKQMETTQYTHRGNPFPEGKILTKQDLQKIVIPLDVPFSRTSGSTGYPVTVPKTNESILWYKATNYREMKWRKWDLSKKAVSILSRNKQDIIKGNTYIKSLAPISELQKYLEEIQPNYIYTYPTVIEQLDLTKLTELIDIKSTGENNGTAYSCEEAGIVALKCLEYGTYHIMENIIVESDDEYGALITDLTNPLITRYALGDVVELSDDLCKCGRTLPIIKKIVGRIRNMLILPNGDKIWPSLGEPSFPTITNKIIRHQIIQKTLYEIEISLQVTECLTPEEETNLINLVLKNLRYNHLKCSIIYVSDFPLGKFDTFKSIV